ncbi:MAG: response regulator [Gammaproteobacteria bacterium]
MPIHNVLVVDDSISARLALRKLLQGFNLTVDMAESGEAALNFLGEKLPDAIFMDHSMPRMNGLQVLERIKANPATASIPVAMYTSIDDAAFQQQVKMAGAVGILSKPATFDNIDKILLDLNAVFDAHGRQGTQPKAAPVVALPAQDASENKIKAVAAQPQGSLVAASVDGLNPAIVALIEKKWAALKAEQSAGNRPPGGEALATLIESRLQDVMQDVQGQVNARLDELDKKIKPGARLGQEDVARIAEALVNRRVADAMQRVMARLDEDSKRKSEGAEQAYRQMMGKHLEEISHQVNARLNDMKEGLGATGKIDAITFDRIQNVTKSIAANIAEERVRDWVDKELKISTASLRIELQQSLKAQRQKIYFMAGLCAFAGTLAAIIVYLLFAK